MTNILLDNAVLLGHAGRLEVGNTDWDAVIDTSLESATLLRPLR